MTSSPDVRLLARFARLVASLHAPDVSDEERRAALRDVTRAARATGVVAHVRAGALTVDGEHVSGTPEIDALGRVLAAHRVVRLVIRQHAHARELAHCAGLLTGDAGARDVRADVEALHLWHVQLDTAALAADSVPATADSALAQLEAAGDTAAVDRAYAALSAWIDQARASDEPETGPTIARVLTRAVALVMADGAVDSARRVDGLSALLVATDLRPIVGAVVDATAPEAAPVLQCVASAAVPLLIERLAAAQSIGERQRCCDALADVGGGFETLVKALGDARWYVVRNVALVLGELRLDEAVRPLARCLSATEPRVRDAAAQALDQIDTASAVGALVPALLDRSVEVRRIAARAVARAARRDVAVPTATCIARLDAEPDAEVAQDLVAALGAIGSPDALRHLRAVITGRTRHAHDHELRAAALRALAEGGTSGGHALARSLRDDGDPLVRRLVATART
ncbi:MAG TPA: HEAT repeat domain-containing protein [Gemmatirosa sp.]